MVIRKGKNKLILLQKRSNEKFTTKVYLKKQNSLFYKFFDFKGLIFFPKGLKSFWNDTVAKLFI